ncbi:MAG: AMP-binding protein [Ideonella sp.]|nr:AMP-binding protein [Ideonella sp.]
MSLAAGSEARTQRHGRAPSLHGYGLSPTPVHLLEEFHALGWLMLEAYGLSENVLPMAMNRPEDFRFGTVGRPVLGNQIVIADDGGIKVRGAGLFRGYLGATEAPTFDVDGFYLTGDLGEFDANGHLRLTGRTGELIKTSTGRRVAPAGVEAKLRSVPGIDQAMLIGNGRKYLVALCTCASMGLDESSRALLTAMVRQQVSRVNENERPRGVALIERPFSIALGELTPNLKLRRGAIEFNTLI